MLDCNVQGCQEDFGGPGQKQKLGPILSFGGHQPTLPMGGGGRGGGAGGMPPKKY